MLKEPGPEPNTNSEPNTKFEAKEEAIQETVNDQSLLNTLDIYIIRATPLVQLAKKPKHIIFTITITNIKKALVPKKHTNPTIKVPIDYHKYLEVFSRKEADKLVEH